MMEWYDALNPNEQKEFECSECGKPLETDAGYCSGTCFEASMMIRYSLCSGYFCSFVEVVRNGYLFFITFIQIKN